MKKNFVKNIGTALMLGLFLSIWNPTNTFAQNRHQTKKHQNKEKVVTPVRHYNNLPRRGAQVAVLPQRAMPIRHGRYNYHFLNGIFYRPIGGTFVIVAPPIGIRLSVLPPKPYHFTYSGHPYYYYYGAFYIPLSDGQGYEVVAPPVGARVDALPDGYEIFELDRKVYYRLDDTYYKAVVKENGAVVYEVVQVN